MGFASRNPSYETAHESRITPDTTAKASTRFRPRRVGRAEGEIHRREAARTTRDGFCFALPILRDAWRLPRASVSRERSEHFPGACVPTHPPHESPITNHESRIAPDTTAKASKRFSPRRVGRAEGETHRREVARTTRDGFCFALPILRDAWRLSRASVSRERSEHVPGACLPTHPPHESPITNPAQHDSEGVSVLQSATQRNPRWQVEVSTGWAMRAAGR